MVIDTSFDFRKDTPDYPTKDPDVHCTEQENEAFMAISYTIGGMMVELLQSGLWSDC